MPRKTYIKKSVKWSRPTAKGKKRVAGAKSLGKLKKELDGVVSRYVRQFWSKEGIVYCYTCNKPMEIKKAQCGHFVPRQYLATRWEFDNLRPQCMGCNVWGRGQLLDFEENVKAELGDERVEQLKVSRNQLMRPDKAFYEQEIARLTELLKSLNP